MAVRARLRLCRSALLHARSMPRPSPASTARSVARATTASSALPVTSFKAAPTPAHHARSVDFSRLRWPRPPLPPVCPASAIRSQPLSLRPLARSARPASFQMRVMRSAASALSISTCGATVHVRRNLVARRARSTRGRFRTVIRFEVRETRTHFFWRFVFQTKYVCTYMMNDTNNQPLRLWILLVIGVVFGFAASIVVVEWRAQLLDDTGHDRV
jgi:hypothetical protein